MIEVACITTRDYARHTGAMLHSALERSAPARLSIHVLADGPLSPEDSARLRTVTEGFGARLRFHEVSDARARSLPGHYFPRDVWFRIFLPDLLPDADRVLYLDSDIVVTDSLAPLWETDLGTNLLAAVTNPFYPFMPPHPRQALGIERPEDYFNSGVLLMNLRRMRQERTTQRLCDYAARNPASAYPDQDALNDVARGRWLHLHPRWNVQSTLFELPPGKLPLPPQQVAEALRDPAVIHFIGPFKPWQYLCRHPRQQAFLDHARRTPWGAPTLEGKTLRNSILRRLPLEWIDRWFAAERFLAGLPGRLRRATRMHGN